MLRSKRVAIRQAFGGLKPMVRRKLRAGAASRKRLSYVLPGQATHEFVVHFYSAASVHFLSVVDRQSRRLTLPSCARNAVEIDAATFAQMSRGLVRTDHRDIESDRDQGEARWDLWDL